MNVIVLQSVFFIVLPVKMLVVDEFRLAGKEVYYGYIIAGLISIILKQIGVLMGMIVHLLISI